MLLHKLIGITACSLSLIASLGASADTLPVSPYPQLIAINQTHKQVVVGNEWYLTQDSGRCGMYSMASTDFSVAPGQSRSVPLSYTNCVMSSSDNTNVLTLKQAAFSYKKLFIWEWRSFPCKLPSTPLVLKPGQIISLIFLKTHTVRQPYTCQVTVS